MCRLSFYRVLLSVRWLGIECCLLTWLLWVVCLCASLFTSAYLVYVFLTLVSVYFTCLLACFKAV